jgi:hypothetical protein
LFSRYAMKCLDKKRVKLKQGETLALNERIMLALVSTGVSTLALWCLHCGLGSVVWHLFWDAGFELRASSASQQDDLHSCLKCGLVFHSVLAVRKPSCPRHAQGTCSAQSLALDLDHLLPE